MYKRNRFKKDTLIKEYRSIKKKKQFTFKEIKENNISRFFYYKLFFFCFLIFLMIDAEKGKIIISFFIKNLKNLNGDIIYENNYDDFEHAKQMFNKDSFLNSHIENITILNHTYNKNYKNLKNNKINVHICVALDDKYIFPLLVSMESTLLNCNIDKTFLIYHILCAPDVTEKTLSILKSLMNKYSLNLEMIFYGMGDSLMYLHKSRLSQVTYYRLLLPLFVNLKRILYLDGDTLIYKDLGEMFQLDFNNNSVLGTLDYYSYGVDYLGLRSDKYINAGVILLNLEKIRNDKKYYDLINITTKVGLNNEDQTAINFVLYPNIGILPNKYNVFNFYDTPDIQVYANYLRQQINVTEIEEIVKNPTIVHHVICTPKIWNKKTKYFEHVSACTQRNDCSCLKYHDIWLSFANKTDYYPEIVKFIDELE